jgi:hypothetical protein
MTAIRQEREVLDTNRSGIVVHHNLFRELRSELVLTSSGHIHLCSFVFTDFDIVDDILRAMAQDPTKTIFLSIDRQYLKTSAALAAAERLSAASYARPPGSLVFICNGGCLGNASYMHVRTWLDIQRTIKAAEDTKVLEPGKHPFYAVLFEKGGKMQSRTIMHGKMVTSDRCAIIEPIKKRLQFRKYRVLPPW